MLRGKVTVGQRFLDTSLNLLRCLRQFHGLQFRNHCGSLFTGCLFALLGVDSFQHLRHIFDLGFGHNGEYISVKMHHTALVLGLRKHLSHSLQHPQALVSNNELNPFKAPSTPPLEEAAPAGLVLLHALGST